MKVKTTFIFETDKYKTYQDLKDAHPKKKSRKRWEEDFSKELMKVLGIFLEDNDGTSRILDLKSKIIERKDNG